METTGRKVRVAAAALGVVVVAVVSSVATTALAGLDGPFPDVPSNSPFADDIAFVADAGIVEGYSDGTFRPGAPVTRQAMAAFLARSQTYTYAIATQQGNDTTSITALALCPEGTVVIGGGVESSLVGVGRVSQSTPDTIDNGWSGAVNVDEPSDYEVITTAICVPGQTNGNG